ncbi:MAG: hypothetical protein WD844_00750 [Thermoleophilaceae bacterium]
MIGGLLRLASTAATVLVVVGFALFALDETREGSAATVSRIADASGGAAERERESHNGGVREAIDDVNDVLLTPFEGIVSGTDSEWVRHGVPALLGFLLYGLALRLLANIPQGRRPEPLGWDVPR